MQRRRVAVLHQGCIPTYRRTFYEQLSMIESCEYVVFHGDPEPGTGLSAAKPPFSFPNIRVRNRFFRMFGRSIVYQPVILKIAFGGYDALVIGHEFKFISSVVLLFIFRALGRPVVFWGFGRTIDPFDRGPFGRAITGLLAWLKDRVILLASDFMAYTDSGAEHVARIGLPRDHISVLWNTIDVGDEITAHGKVQSLDRAALRSELGLSSHSIVLTFVGRLFAIKQVHILPEVVRHLREEDKLSIEVVIVGGGPDEVSLKDQFGDQSWCHFLGPIYDKDQIARVFRASDAVVVPGLIGLAINHAFAHGLPVITCASSRHGPEIEYVSNGINGMVVNGVAGLREGLRRFAQSAALRTELSRGAMETRDKLRLERMTNGFHAAIDRALRRS